MKYYTNISILRVLFKNHRHLDTDVPVMDEQYIAICQYKHSQFSKNRFIAKSQFPGFMKLTPARAHVYIQICSNIWIVCFAVYGRLRYNYIWDNHFLCKLAICCRGYADYMVIYTREKFENTLFDIVSKRTYCYKMVASISGSEHTPH